MFKNKDTLWTKNFTIITIGTILSAIGGVALNFAISLVVYNETNSTWLTGIYSAVTTLPYALLPIFIAPYVDAMNRKKLIVNLDYLLGIIYTIFGVYVLYSDFNYNLFLVIGTLGSIIGAIYSLTYESIYPELIEEGYSQKGYSVSIMIYPSVTAFITPIAAFIYNYFGVAYLFMGEGILLLMAASCELFIDFEERERTYKAFDFKVYLESIKEGFEYFKDKKGILCIFVYMSFANFASAGIGLLLIPFFNTHRLYNATHYSFLMSAEMVGRMVGGFTHYLIKIPIEKRYAIASKVYVLYEILDGSIMFLTFPLMIVIKFVLGFLGVNSANIRESSVQNYIPSQKRARVNSFFHLMTIGAVLIAKLLAGAVGEFMALPIAGALFAITGVISALLMIIKQKQHIQPIYNQSV